jgi:hypothetical protein
VRVFTWPGVRLSPGENQFEARCSDGEARDGVRWTVATAGGVP